MSENISNTLFHTYLGTGIFCFYALGIFFLKKLSGMANTVDPDQTTNYFKQSDLCLHCLHMPFCETLSVQTFRKFTILYNVCLLRLAQLIR